MRHYFTKRRGCGIHILIAANDTEYENREKSLDRRLGFVRYRRNTDATTYVKGKTRYMLFATTDINTIAHETLHLVKSLRFPNEEKQACFCGGFVEWLWKMRKRASVACAK